jgi:hypothetical protein
MEEEDCNSREWSRGPSDSPSRNDRINPSYSEVSGGAPFQYNPRIPGAGDHRGCCVPGPAAPATAFRSNSLYSARYALSFSVMVPSWLISSKISSPLGLPKLTSASPAAVARVVSPDANAFAAVSLIRLNARGLSPPTLPSRRNAAALT